MTEFVKVARVDDIPPGGRLWYEFEEETVIIFNVDDTFYCIADLCTHDNSPLEDGALEGHEVECPRHGARFDVRTGAALCLPAVTAVPTFQVKVERGNIYVESPDVW
jgi:3-phenylpropionate/trans-cinnamate dioxygenase ferredoxin subunit